MTYDSHRLTASGIIEVRLRTDTGWHRYCLCPGQSLADQPPEVADTANAAWTDEVKENWHLMRSKNRGE